MPEPTSASLTLRAQREQTIRALCEHFAADHLEVAEFERRLDVANRATQSAELEALTADLVAAKASPAPAAQGRFLPASAPTATPAPASASKAVPSPAPAATPSPSSAANAAQPAPSSEPAPAPETARGGVARPARGNRSHQVMLGLMGAATRRGRWLPARDSTAVAIMGGVLLDFREAELAAGETVVHTVAIWGGVTIIVPPDLDVAVSGVGIMGSFDHLGDASLQAGPDAPRLRIDGVALMGGVDVRVQARGEPIVGWDAGAHAVGAHYERHARLRELRARRRELRQEARRLRSEWRGRR